MRIIFFNHPSFIGSQSMPRFANMLAEGMRAQGNDVEFWRPKPLFVKLPAPHTLKKWLGYIDQFIVFPHDVRKRLKSCPADTLFVFTDNAQGPWVPLVADRPHVVHCHDFLAQRSALGEIPENPTGWTGRLYQAYIRRGFSKGKNFISVSKKTRDDLHALLPTVPACSEVVYNGLNQAFPTVHPDQAKIILGQKIGTDLTAGFLLHVGSNQWYKNRTGVIDIYDAWRNQSSLRLPLLLIGIRPNARIVKRYLQSPYRADIQLLSGLDNKLVRMAYAGASVFVFPSLDEGFGWPIAEAMASGCPVITTGKSPMTEVAGRAGFYIPRRPNNEAGINTWAKAAARVVEFIVRFSQNERDRAVKAGLDNAKRFDPVLAIDQIETIYRRVLRTEKSYESTSYHR